MEVKSASHHRLFTLGEGKFPPYPMDRMIGGWVLEPVWMRQLGEKSLPLPGIEPRSSSP